MVNSGPTSIDRASLADARDRALQATGIPFLIADAQVPGLPIVWINEAFTQATGYTLAEVRGRSPELLAGPGTDRPALAALAAAITARREHSVTLLSYRADGVPFWNRVTASPVPGPDGQVTHWVISQVDVTEQVATSAAQREAFEVERRSATELGIVSQVSDLLMDLEDPQSLEKITRLLSGEVVEWAGFFLNDGGLLAAEGIDVDSPPTGRGRRHGGGALPVADQPPALTVEQDPVQRLLEGKDEGPFALDLTSAGPPGTASHWLVAHLRAELPAAGQDPADARVLLVPVAGRRRVLGLLAFIPLGSAGRISGAGPRGAADAHGEIELDPATVTVVRLTVRRVGLALDNVRLYAREHSLAETLQRAMLPQEAQVDDVDVWTYYSPNAEHAQVGGDWYDVLQLAPDVVGVVIGDVVGHDVEAAATMGQLRSVVRTFAHELTDPGHVLERVDQLVAGMNVPRAASLVLATLSRLGETWTLRYSRAGHLPVVMLRDGTPQLLTEAGGPLIGFGGRPRESATVELNPGDVLVLYTDGLIERRDRPLREGLAALTALVADISAIDAAGIGEDLLSGLVDQPEDDVAVVVLRLPDPATDGAAPARSSRRRRWVLPSEPTSIGRARHAVLRTSQAWNLPDVASAELVVSELVANAVLHGWGHISLRLFDTGDGLRIEVEDANPAPPVTTDGHPGRVGGYGMQIVERLAEWGWRPSPAGKLVWARVRPGSDTAGIIPVVGAPGAPGAPGLPGALGDA